MTPERLLTCAQVAALFAVNSKTVSRWERQRRLTCIRTLGGHRRFREAEVLELLAGNTTALAAS